MIRYCTITGTDDRTNFSQLIDISEKYPFVEWGILYSPTRSGNHPRYPSIGYIYDFIYNINKNTKHNVNISLHICGKGISDLYNYEYWINNLIKHFKRIQLNLKHKDINDINLGQLIHSISNLNKEIITQYNEDNINLIEVFHQYLFNTSSKHSVLFDSYGSKGIVEKKWNKPLDHIDCGYAGGLSNLNIKTHLPEILKISNYENIWIDMESGVRTDDKLDLSKVIEVLDHVNEYKNIKQFGPNIINHD